MLVPSIFDNHFTDNFFDDMFAFPFASGKSMRSMMNTDIQDLGDSYRLDIELPGYEKKDIHAELDNGYLTISASHEDNKEEKDDKGSFVRRERYSGSCTRNFYVGDHVKEEDIHAGFENGVLKLVFPKEDKQEKLENKKYIAIE